MKIIAHQQYERYLVEVGNGQGRILYLSTHCLSLPNDLQAILTHTGEWESYTGAQEELLWLLTSAERLPYDDGPLAPDSGPELPA